ncbi:MAG: hypothetical protein H0V09_06885 [Gemmatimonadetes bacterium]|nr:hypothetical protein [Gemmatimonadota bacterium]
MTTVRGLPAALVIGCGRGGLAAVRSLGRRRVEVWVAGPEAGPPAASRYARGYLATPSPLTDPGAFVDALCELAPAFENRAVLIPTDDVCVELLAEHHAALAAAYRLLGPPPAVARAIVDKAVQYAIVARAGIPLPRTWVVDAPGAAQRIAAEACFPLIVKPRFSQRFFLARRIKALTAHTPLELAVTLDALPEGMLVQERVEGRLENGYEYSSFVDASGHVAAGLVLRKLDSHPRPFGNTTAVETVHAPAVEALGRDVLRAFGYRGISQSEFKLDPRSGAFRFIEINPRIVNNTAIEHAAGADTVYPAYAEAAGLPVERATPRPARTVWLCPELRLPYSGALLPPRKLPESLGGPTRYVTDLFVAHDPGPLCRKASIAARTRARRVGRRLRLALVRVLGLTARPGATTPPRGGRRPPAAGSGCGTAPGP